MRTLFLASLVVVAAACGNKSSKPGEEPARHDVPFTAEGMLAFERGGTPIVDIVIEIADDDSTRMRGLMERSALPDRAGMLFVFPAEEVQSFWMANTQMALDLVFVNAAGSIVSISKYAKPLSTEPVTSLGRALYVVEVPAGFADTWGLVEGDTITWERY